MEAAACAAPDGAQASPREDDESRDADEPAAAAAAAPPAARLPTLLPPTLEDPPPPPAAASGPLVRAHTSPLATRPPRPSRSQRACSLPRPAALRQPAGPEALLLLPLPPPPSTSRARELGWLAGPRIGPAVGQGEARSTSLAPPPALAADWTLRGNRLHPPSLPPPPAPPSSRGRAPWENPPPRGTRSARPGAAARTQRGGELSVQLPQGTLNVSNCTG
ncbi:basic proline-rich protein-like [Bubalus bubalis]|uniref:basic proline-rich protein-like n=1 Tax=Bubalus bubalis TaxID=89462 RepID=UPI001E1B9D98|nr:basic proline-rich protein-like [Bubalus bubalis]